MLAIIIIIIILCAYMQNHPYRWLHNISSYDCTVSVVLNIYAVSTILLLQNCCKEHPCTYIFLYISDYFLKINFLELSLLWKRVWLFWGPLLQIIKWLSRKVVLIYISIRRARKNPSLHTFTNNYNTFKSLCLFDRDKWCLVFICMTWITRDNKHFKLTFC